MQPTFIMLQHQHHLAHHGTHVCSMRRCEGINVCLMRSVRFPQLLLRPLAYGLLIKGACSPTACVVTESNKQPMRTFPAHASGTVLKETHRLAVTHYQLL